MEVYLTTNQGVMGSSPIGLAPFFSLLFVTLIQSFRAWADLLQFLDHQTSVWFGHSAALPRDPTVRGSCVVVLSRAVAPNSGIEGRWAGPRLPLNPCWAADDDD